MADRSSRWALISLLTLGGLLLLGLAAACTISDDLAAETQGVDRGGIDAGDVFGALAPLVFSAAALGLATLAFLYFQLVVAWGLERRPATRLTAWLPLLLVIVPVGLALAFAAFILDLGGGLDALRDRPQPPER